MALVDYKISCASAEDDKAGLENRARQGITCGSEIGCRVKRSSTREFGAADKGYGIEFRDHGCDLRLNLSLSLHFHHTLAFFPHAAPKVLGIRILLREGRQIDILVDPV